jgi:penicillin amidase
LNGRIYLDGLTHKITIYRDKWGIPYISASSRHDLFFAQGFIHAQDRLWQLDMNRRVAKGQLSAVVGPAALDTDRLTRTLGFSRLARARWKQTTDRVRRDVSSYADGINAYLDREQKLPVEFALLRYQPEPWDALDSVAFAHLLTWSLSHGSAGELVRARLVDTLGANAAAELEPIYPERNPITLSQGIQFNRLEVDGMLNAASGPFITRGIEGAGKGSNAWAISSKHSDTGHAILCNDMHLPITTPSLWYYMHLRGESCSANGDDLHAAGVSLPGTPYILIGHNEDIAWGATLSFVDTEDLFVEEIDSINGNRYRFRDEWQENKIHQERIEVRGRQDHLEKVIETHHGPIISNVLSDSGQSLSLSAVALQPHDSFEGFSRLMEAGNWDEFVKAVRHINSPSLNLLYADSSDNIGHYVTGLVPIRNTSQGLVPAQGWSGDYEWSGYVPFDDMPHCLNPESGYLVTANNRIVTDDYPHYLGSLWMNGYRAHRLEQLLEKNEQISIEDCQRFQVDYYSIPGIDFSELLAGMNVSSQDAALSLRLLQSWDGWLGPESVGGLVYEVLLNKLSYEILSPQLGQELTAQYLGAGHHPVLLPISEFQGHWSATLIRLLKDRDSRWLPASKREAILEYCLADTTKELRQILGDDPSEWRWGRLHKIGFDHALSIQPALDAIFGHGQHEIGGDTDTVNQTAVAPGKTCGPIAVAPSYRQIVDLADLSNSRAMHVPGQSGHLSSPNYGDLVNPWLQGEYYPMIWNEDDVKSQAVNRLVLAPPLE